MKQRKKGKEGEESRSMKKSNNVPKQVGALADYMLDIPASEYYQGTNTVMCGQETQNENK